MTEENRNCGIYAWWNKVNGKVYVGQSKNMKFRKSQFLSFNIRYSGDLINRARHKYNSPEYWDYQILEYCEPEELDIKEQAFIWFYNANDRRYGYNSTSGGESHIATEETKLRMREANTTKKAVYQIDYDTDEIIKTWPSAYDVQRELGICSSCITKCCKGRRSSIGGYRWCYADNMIPRRERISLKGRPNPKISRENNALFRKHRTEEDKEHMREKMKGRILSEEHRKAMCKPKKNYTVRQFDLESGEFIAEYVSIREASRQTGAHVNGIRLNLSGKYTQAGGYRWEYGEPIKRIPKHIIDNEEYIIYQLNDRGEIINEFKNHKVASENLNINTKTIRTICRTGKPTSRTNVILVYKKDYNNPDSKRN